jgi:hypothetical protein
MTPAPRFAMPHDQHKDDDRDITVRPHWTRVVAAREVVAQSGRFVLHAGPPFRDPSSPSIPTLNAAILACLHEGWADSEASAEKLIRERRVALVPAQDHGVVMPLAAVATPRSLLVEVADPAAPTRRAWSLLGSGMAGPQLRFGARDPAILARLRFRDDVLGPACTTFLEAPIDLVPIARAGVIGGDDLHGRNIAATAALAAARPAPPALAQTLATTPLFFLTLWMAACTCMAMVFRDRRSPNLVTALGGNGESFGLQRADAPGEWIMAPANSPAGPLPPGLTQDDIAGAIGDSGIIDAMGFGGQAIDRAPELVAHFGAALPDDLAARRALYPRAHPDFADLGLRAGLDAGRVAASGVTPLVVIAMLRKTGGLAGRGLYRPPLALFS